MIKDTQLIHQNELFNELTEDEFSRLSPLWTSREVVKDEAVFQEGADATHLYVIEEGSVALRKRIPGSLRVYTAHTVVATCNSTEVFGWSALVEPHEYTLSATALEPTSLVSIEAADMRPILDEDRSIGYKVHTALAVVVSRRLRQLSQSLTFEREPRGLPKTSTALAVAHLRA